MQKLWLLIALAGCIACGETDKDQVPQDLPSTNYEDSSAASPQVDTFLSAETFRFFNNSGYTDFSQNLVTGFDWSNFKLVNVWKEDSMLVQPFIPEADYYERYGRFLKYSPDSSMFIDLDSYNIDIRKDGNRWTGTENGPDMEISLIDREEKEKIRLVFTGPGGSIEDGGWIDNETLVLTGFQELGRSDSLAAIVYKFHLPSQTYFLYEMEEAGDARKIMGSWRRERLKDVQIR